MFPCIHSLNHVLKVTGLFVQYNDTVIECNSFSVHPIESVLVLPLRYANEMRKIGMPLAYHKHLNLFLRPGNESFVLLQRCAIHEQMGD